MPPIGSLTNVHETIASARAAPPLILISFRFRTNERIGGNIDIQSAGVYLYSHPDPRDDSFGASLTGPAQGNSPYALHIAHRVFVKYFPGVC